MIKQTLAAAAVIAGFAHAASAATIVNGSFEQTALAGGTGFVTYGVGNTDLTGWDIVSGSIDHIRDYWNASEGDQSLDMSGGSAGTISQTITDLIVGMVYRIDFDMAGNPDNTGDTIKNLFVSAIENVTYEFDIALEGGTRADMKWNTYQFYFTAADTTQLLSFASLDNSAYGPALDNVYISQVAAVPLPATALLLLAGIGGIGAASRRRAKS